MARHSVFSLRFAKRHALYVQKAQRKQRTSEEVDQIIAG